MRPSLFLAAALLLAACQTGPEEPTPDPAARAACEAEGGTYGRFGLAQEYLCQTTTPDAGKACTRGSDCTGLCLSDSDSGSGACSSFRPMFGCHGILLDDGTETVICID